MLKDNGGREGNDRIGGGIVQNSTTSFFLQKRQLSTCRTLKESWHFLKVLIERNVAIRMQRSILQQKNCEYLYMPCVRPGRTPKAFHLKPISTEGRGMHSAVGRQTGKRQANGPSQKHFIYFLLAAPVHL